MSTAKTAKELQQSATVYGVLFAISGSHLFNDAIQSVVPAMNPIFEQTLNLSYAQIGWIAFVLNMTSSVMQPVLGYFSDKRPTPFLLPFGMLLSMLGLIGFGLSPNFYVILASVFFIGLGSAVFHPEGSRVSYMAAGPRRGLAQSIYQVGGNFGQSLAPIFTAFIFVRYGQKGSLGFTVVALMGMILLLFVSRWYKSQLEMESFASGGRKKEEKKLEFTQKSKLLLLYSCFLSLPDHGTQQASGTFINFT